MRFIDCYLICQFAAPVEVQLRVRDRESDGDLTLRCPQTVQTLISDNIPHVIQTRVVLSGGEEVLNVPLAETLPQLGVLVPGQGAGAEL